MKLSVLIITYNHEKYISQALDSVLMQEVNFAYEIVIGEDCSSDRTRDILIEYQKKYPEKIRLLLHKQNLGNLGKNNLIKTHHACRGEYIALLEGDDYWTSSLKLQKQTDYLDRNPDFAICFTSTLAFYEDGSHTPYVFPDLNYKEISTLKDLLCDNFMHTCSVMFRNRLFKSYPKWYHEIITGDYALHIINASYGKIGFINEVMSAYRIHKDGIWSMRQKDNMGRNYKSAIALYSNLTNFLDNRYHKILEKRLFQCFRVLMEKYIESRDIKEVIKLFLKSVKIFKTNITMIIKLLLMIAMKTFSQLKKSIINMKYAQL